MLADLRDPTKVVMRDVSHRSRDTAFSALRRRFSGKITVILVVASLIGLVWLASRSAPKKGPRVPAPRTEVRS
jgi:hypothetical protein